MRHYINLKKDLIATLILISVGLLAFTIMFYITVNGPGVSPDSIVYIETSQSILNGDGFYFLGKPITIWPPVYPSILAIAGVFQTDKILAARWLHAIFYAVNVILFGLSAYILTRRNMLALVSSVLLFMTSATMLDIHSMAWSEPPFIFFSLAAFLLISMHFEKQNRYALVGAGICLGLAMATRYVGITLIPPFFVCLFFLNKDYSNNVRDGSIVIIGSCLPLMGWIIRNMLVAGTTLNRTIIFHPITLSEIKKFLHNLYNIFLPIDIYGELKLLQLIFMGVIYFISIKFLLKEYIKNNKEIDAAVVFQILGIIFFFSYILLFIISISFIDAQLTLDNRNLSLIYIFISLQAISLCFKIVNMKNNKTILLLFLVCISFIIHINIDRSIKLGINSYKNGRDFTAKSWKNSSIIQFIKLLPDGQKIYSNGWDVIYFKEKKKAEMIPLRILWDRQTLNKDYDKEMEFVCKDIIQNGAIIAHFDDIKFRYFLPTTEEIQKSCNNVKMYHLPDGIIYTRYNSSIHNNIMETIIKKK